MAAMCVPVCVGRGPGVRQVLLRPLTEFRASLAVGGAPGVPPADALSVFDEVVTIVQRCPVLQLLDLPQIVSVRAAGSVCFGCGAGGVVCCGQCAPHRDSATAPSNPDVRVLRPLP